MFEAVFARGTTPIHMYEVPYKPEEIKKVSVTYRQNGLKIITKRDAECIIREGAIYIKLTQEETLQFQEGEATAQIKIGLTTGEVQRSVDHRIQVLDIADEEVF